MAGFPPALIKRIEAVLASGFTGKIVLHAANGTIPGYAFEESYRTADLDRLDRKQRTG